MSRYLSQSHQRLVPAYLAAIILGIVGMHALMQHCPTPEHTMTASSSSMAISHHLDDSLMAATPATTAAAAAVEAAAGQPHGSFDEMLMLCAAMLFGAGALLTLLLARRLRRTVTLLRLVPTLWRPRPTLAGTGPPVTLAFTVIRC